jgi:RNA polymerase sigma factor (sigma-70 family)
VIYSDRPTPEKIVQAMLSGALDYLQWPFEPPVLEAALARLATAGERHAQKEKLRMDAKRAVDDLSPREREILVLMTKGMSNKDMAAAVDLSPRTIELHRKNMMRRLAARSPSDAVRIAIYAGVDEGVQDLSSSADDPATR